MAALSLTIASCGFCSSDQRFAIRLPSDSTLRWTPLSLAVSFPLPGQIRDFHPLATCAARRTKKRDYPPCADKSRHFRWGQDLLQNVDLIIPFFKNLIFPYDTDYSLMSVQYTRNNSVFQSPFLSFSSSIQGYSMQGSLSGIATNS